MDPPPHSHTHHQLAWTRRGVLSVGVGEVYWVLPPTRALWLPAGVTRATGATREAVLCSLYLAPERCPLDWTEPTAVGIDGLLAELIGYLARTDLTDDARSRAEAVVEGRRIIMHGMHSVVDWLAFAIWEDGTLVRSLSLSGQRDHGEHRRTAGVRAAVLGG